MHVREALLQAANQFEVVLERQIGMQSANDVKFGSAFRDTLSGALVNLLQREIVCAGRIRRASEGAQPTMRDADVRGIDMAIHVVIADVAVLLLANIIREPA